MALSENECNTFDGRAGLFRKMREALSEKNAGLHGTIFFFYYICRAIENNTLSNEKTINADHRVGGMDNARCRPDGKTVPLGTKSNQRPENGGGTGVPDIEEWNRRCEDIPDT